MEIENVVRLLANTFINMYDWRAFTRINFLAKIMRYKESEELITWQRGEISGRLCTLWSRALCYIVPEVKRQKASSRDVVRPTTKNPKLIVDQLFSQGPSSPQLSYKHIDSGWTNITSFGVHHNLHPSVEKLKLTEIIQKYQIARGEGLGNLF